MGDLESTDERNLISSISSLKLEAGDILVVKTEIALSSRQAQSTKDNVRNLLRGIGKKDVLVLVLDRGASLEKVSLPKEDIVDVIVEDIKNKGKIFLAIHQVCSIPTSP